MKSVRIETVANGFIAHEDILHGERFRDAMVAVGVPHVFESFDSLIDWLDANLDKPKPAVKPAESASKC